MSSTIFSSIGCSFKLFKEIKIVLPHMDIMKLNDLARIQWYMCSWNAELQDSLSFDFKDGILLTTAENIR